MRLVDVTLPLAFIVFLVGKFPCFPLWWKRMANDLAEVFACFGAAGLAIAAVGWFAIAIPVVIVVLITIQRFYVRTSKQLRILEYV